MNDTWRASGLRVQNVVREHVLIAERQDQEFSVAHDERPGGLQLKRANRRLDCCEAWCRVDADIVIDVTRDGQNQPALLLPYELPSENPQAVVMLVHSFVVSALEAPVNLEAFVHEMTGIQHDIDRSGHSWNFRGSAGPHGPGLTG